MARFSNLCIVVLFCSLFVSCSVQYTSRLPVGKNQKSEQSLRAAAQKWIGTPYRYGGNDHRGIDCSGLVCRLYQEVYGRSLPRQANQQRQLGYSVHYPYLKPGDLIFFRFEGQERIEHVGLYLGQGQFIHASTSRGVVIDGLDDVYYRRHIVVVKRLVH